MNKNSFLVGTLAFVQFFAQAQSSDLPKEDQVNRTDIELVYNNYIQDGNNSAVTGGLGTEELYVYGPSLNYARTIGRTTLSANVGTDIISSASTDNIDFIVSSASILDARTYANFGVGHLMENQQTSWYTGGGFSIESDYLSLNLKAGLIHKNKKKGRTYSLQFQRFWDDLRWGRLQDGLNLFKPRRLIYPQELRFREWHENTKRHSYNLQMGLDQVVNKRLVMGIYPEFTYQDGLLSTPFHRVYFEDGSLAVEALPSYRYKGSLGLKLNAFVGGSVVLRNSVNGYADSFGVRGLSLENETVIKLDPSWSVAPSLRYYTQQGSRYFAPLGQHQAGARYASSDWDLADFHTWTVGTRFRYSPQAYISKRMKFNSMSLQYSYYDRSNGLYSHLISLSVETSWDKKKR
jgi:hypothetical protein